MGNLDSVPADSVCFYSIDWIYGDQLDDGRHHCSFSLHSIHANYSLLAQVCMVFVKTL